MLRARLGLLAAPLLLVAALTLLAAAAAEAQTAAELEELDKRVSQLLAQGKVVEATPLAELALVASERVLGPEHRSTLESVSRLAALYFTRGRYDQAEPLLDRALEGFERVLGKDDPRTLRGVSALAALYQSQGRYNEAEPLCRHALAARTRVLGAEHQDTLKSLSSLAGLYREQGRYGQAEPLYRRVLAARERVLGKEHPDTFSSVNDLAALYEKQGRYDEAAPLYVRAVTGFARVLGENHLTTIRSINSLAKLYRTVGQYNEAERLLRFALAGFERVLGESHPDSLESLSNMAAVYHEQGRYGDAEAFYTRALEARELALGKDHPDTLRSLSGMAAFYLARDRYSKAEPFCHRALAGFERVFGKDHPYTLRSVSQLGALYFAQRNWSRAAELWRRSTVGIAAHTQRGALEARIAGKKRSEAEQSSWQFAGLVKVVYRLVPEGRPPDAAVACETFRSAQWALSSEAAQSLAQMAARGAKGDGPLAALVRERQDLLAEWQKREALRNAALGRAAAERNAEAENENNGRMSVIDRRIAEIDKQLAVEFPDYAALASPAPLTVEEVQAQLGTDEALVLFLDLDARFPPTPEETFIWVVTKTDVRWVRSDLGTAALTREVQALRCGLDANAWGGPNCAKLTDHSYTEADRNAGKPPPFDHARAHALYKALFGQLEDLIKGKHLLIVPSGPLTQLPFQVLVTAPPASDHKSAAWLVRSHALTVLPAVSSLKALRRVSRSSHATKPMIGFGNPLLDGPQNDPQFGAYYKKRARHAREKQRCGTSALQHIAAFLAWRGGGGVAQVQTRGGLAQTRHIRMQTPLPETADELCAVARALKADAGDMRLGAQASEHEVKGLSTSGQLAQYRVVHFATHGALAGELKGLSEPGLLLTPPDTASEEDDGYLSASEIASLKLDADWVVLSACNTAAGNAEGAQALSGLARAFIYAQARALLVSHWAVDSAATVKLITGAMREMAADAQTGRAEALRRSMLALIDKGKEKEAHPAYWAPFVVVGEGGR